MKDLLFHTWDMLSGSPAYSAFNSPVYELNIRVGDVLHITQLLAEARVRFLLAQDTYDEFVQDLLHEADSIYSKQFA